MHIKKVVKILSRVLLTVFLLVYVGHLWGEKYSYTQS